MNKTHGTYKGAGQTIVTVPLDPELHKKLRIYAATEGKTIKWVVTEAIKAALKGQS